MISPAAYSAAVSLLARWLLEAANEKAASFEAADGKVQTGPTAR